MKLIAIALATVGAFLNAFPLRAQMANERLSKQSVISQMEAMSGPAEWRKSAVDPNSQGDDVPRDIRQERNAYWDSHLPAVTGAQHGIIPLGADELLPIPGSLLVVVTFESSKVFEPKLGDGAYTDIRFRISQVLGNGTNAIANSGQTIDVGIVGGSLKRLDGSEIHSNLDYDPYQFMIGHTYLLQLRYFPSGKFFRDLRRWDMTSGAAIPAGLIEAYAFVNGKAKIGGAAKNAAISVAKQLAAGVDGGQR